MTAAKTTPAEFRCSCGLRTPVEIACEHEGAARVVSRCMASLGPVGTAMLSYLALHRPARHRLTWEKTERVLGELLNVYDAGVLTYERQTHRLTDAAWLAALAAVRDRAPKLSLPLDGHGYLYTVLAAEAAKANAAAEAERTARARGETPVGYSAAHAQVSTVVQDFRTTVDTPGRGEPVEPRADDPVVPMPDSVREALKNFGKGRKAIAAAPASDEPRGIPPRSVKPERTVPCMAHVDGRDQLVEIVSRKGTKLTVRLLEAAPGYENTVTISVKDLR